MAAEIVVAAAVAGLTVVLCIGLNGRAWRAYARRKVKAAFNDALDEIYKYRADHHVGTIDFVYHTANAIADRVRAVRDGKPTPPKRTRRFPTIQQTGNQRHSSYPRGDDDVNGRNAA